MKRCEKKVRLIAIITRGAAAATWMTVASSHHQSSSMVASVVVAVVTEAVAVAVVAMRVDASEMFENRTTNCLCPAKTN
jgi:subtilase family serine protease